MYKGVKILCVIPARGGSKGIRNKNIKPLNNRPLITWTIDQVQQSDYIDDYFVSTDDPKIRKVCIDFGSPVIERPKELSKDESPSYETIIHAIRFCQTELDYNYDMVIMVECTSPLRSAFDIDNMIMEFIDNAGHYDTAVGCCRLISDTGHPECAKVEVDGYLMPYMTNTKPIYQRQQLSEVYGVFGGMYIAKVDQYIREKTFYSHRVLPFYLEQWQRFEIDDEIDFDCVEMLHRKYCL